jgi:hypothetical protein
MLEWAVWGCAPEIQRGEQWRGGLAQQVSQPLCADGAEALSAAERHVAGALGPHAARHQHVPIRAHLASTECSAAMSNWKSVRTQGIGARE